MLWSSKKQQSLEHSFIETEFCTVTSRTAQVFWLQYLLPELDIKLDQITSIYCDNLSTTHYSTNCVSLLDKTSCIGISFCKRTSSARCISCPTHFWFDQLVDTFTKPFSKARFYYRFSETGLAQRPSILRDV